MSQKKKNRRYALEIEMVVSGPYFNTIVRKEMNLYNRKS
jgi:hypothetical protein